MVVPLNGDPWTNKMADRLIDHFPDWLVEP
jgi:hypothetical protein